MRCFLPIPVLGTTPGQEDHRMMTIGTMPRVLSSFFRPQRRFFSQPAWPHFWGLVMAMAVGLEHTVGRLNALLRGHTHRTNDGGSSGEAAGTNRKSCGPSPCSSSADSIAQANPSTS